MLTTPQKAKKLLKQRKARVVGVDPFVIKLLYATGETKQDITLGVDAESKRIGVSTTLLQKGSTEDGEDIEKHDTQKARFDNTKRTKGCSAPFVQNKVNAHIRMIDKLQEILPISNDIQKLKDPDICCVGYQQGDQLGFWNIREYVLYRDGHRCHGEKNYSNASSLHKSQTGPLLSDLICSGGYNAVLR